MKQSLNYLNQSISTEENLAKTELLSLEKIAFKKYSSNKCFYCGKTIKSMNDKTIDHITPIIRGGIDAPSNFLISCLDCNKEKANMTREEFIEYRRLTANWNKKIKEKVREMFLQQIQEFGQVDLSTTSREQLLIRLVDFLITDLNINKILEIDTANLIYIETRESITRVKNFKLIQNFVDAYNSSFSSSNKKVQQLIKRYEEDKELEEIEIYKGIVLSIYSYYAYVHVLKLNKVKIKNVKSSKDINKLSAKARRILSANNLY